MMHFFFQKIVMMFWMLYKSRILQVLPSTVYSFILSFSLPNSLMLRRYQFGEISRDMIWKTFWKQTMSKLWNAYLTANNSRKNMVPSPKLT